MFTKEYSYGGSELYKNLLRITKFKRIVFGYFIFDEHDFYGKNENSSIINVMIFLYDEEDNIVGVNYRGIFYYYVYDTQGNVISIYDEYGTSSMSYQYDAWGRIRTIYDSGCPLYNVNPITYRGYYYDNDLGLYYLQSRYYEPGFGRFINADDPRIALESKEETDGTNLFAYCCNDPVNNVDYTGYWNSKVHYGYNKKNKKNHYYKFVNSNKYYGTYYWAKAKVGYSDKNAKRIGYYCNQVDDIFGSTDSNWKIYDQWHFFDKDGNDVRSKISNTEQNYATNCFNTARTYYDMWQSYIKKYGKDAKKTKDAKKKYDENLKYGLMHLGYSLHPIQDKYSHKKSVCYQLLNKRWMHPPKVGIDNPDMHQKAVSGNTADKTIKILKKFFDKYEFLRPKK